ncbi:hypothetical protein CDAR_576421 [Caerostris darwini]|uniref:Uncharacterized protein n=1 Tax=Caerostris darwini TaxID=1538125 RepID=A0AAV4V236_9ARAC|nr:hypothetical protein CDAR_576421 [Caerostris darwini]
MNSCHLKSISLDVGLAAKQHDVKSDSMMDNKGLKGRSDSQRTTSLCLELSCPFQNDGAEGLGEALEELGSGTGPGRCRPKVERCYASVLHHTYR